MRILGLRCSPSEYSFAVLSGTQAKPNLVIVDRVRVPSGYSHCDLLKWFYLEVEGLIKKYKISGIGLKGTEALAQKGKAFGERSELEAIAFLQSSLNGIKYTKRKVNGTIAKDLGLKGKGKYLGTQVDYSAFNNYLKLHKHSQEAIQVALSMLHNK